RQAKGSRVSAPSAVLAPERPSGPTPASTITLMNRNEQPQTRASAPSTASCCRVMFGKTPSAFEGNGGPRRTLGPISHCLVLEVVGLFADRAAAVLRQGRAGETGAFDVPEQERDDGRLMVFSERPVGSSG